MTKMEKAIYDKLNRLFKENGFADVTITMKSTGNEITLQPCFPYDFKPDGNTELRDAEFILAAGVEDAQAFCGTVEQVCNGLANYDGLHAKWIDETKKIEKYYAKYIKDGSREDPEWMERWGWYSDWYKDLFGHRPTRECHA